MDVNKVVENVKVKAAEAKEKVANIDWDNVKEEVKGIDMGVALTKAEDALKKMDIEGKKKAVVDYVKGPKMDKVKGAARTVKDFMGYVPYYAQSVPNMIKEALGKDV